MLLPLTCLKRDFLKVLQSLRGYIDTILPKSLGHIATLAYRQACPEAVVRGLPDKIEINSQIKWWFCSLHHSKLPLSKYQYFLLYPSTLLLKGYKGKH